MDLNVNPVSHSHGSARDTHLLQLGFVSSPISQSVSEVVGSFGRIGYIFSVFYDSSCTPSCHVSASGRAAWIPHPRLGVLTGWWIRGLPFSVLYYRQIFLPTTLYVLMNAWR